MKGKTDVKEFFGIGGYTREPEGFLSWQHITFVLILMTTMVALAVWLGLSNRDKTDKQKNKALIWSAILINTVEIIKLVAFCINAKNPFEWIYHLPLFLCSIQLITIPLAAFTKGRIREASLDFVMIFGILGAVLGTIGAAQNYGCYPVLSIDNVASGITHSISGFASLYIGFARMQSLKKKNIFITFSIMGVAAILAYIANIIFDKNYMFLMAGDGTPYDILYNLVNGHKVFYPICVVALFVVYICVFYLSYFAIQNAKENSKSTHTIEEAEAI